MAIAQQAGEPTIDLFGVLRRRWWTVLLGTLLGVGAAVAYYFVAPRVYGSTAEMLVMRKDPEMPMRMQQAPDQMEQEVGDKLLATHMEIIRSQRVIDAAITTRKLNELPVLQSMLDSEVAKVDPRRAAIEYISDCLDVERGGRGLEYEPLTFVVDLRHGSPTESATILQAIVEAYQDFLSSTLQGVNSEAASLIAAARQDLGTDIKQQQERYRDFRMNTSLLNLTEDGLNKHQIRLMQLETEQTRLELRLSEIDSRLKILNEASQAGELAYSDFDRLGLIDKTDVDRLALLVTVERGDATQDEVFQADLPTRESTAQAEADRLLTLQMQLREERSRLGDQHPKVVDLQSAVREVSQFVNSKKADLSALDGRTKVASGPLVSAYSKMLQKDREDVQRRLELIRTSVANEELQAKSLVADQLKDDEMKDDLDRTKELQLAVIERLRQLNMLGDFGGYVTEVIQRVQVGELVWPSLPLVLAGGLCLGLLGGCGMGLLIDLGDRHFRSTAEVEELFGSSLLGSIGKLKGKLGRSTDRLLSAELVAYHQPQSPAAESFRHLRTGLFFHKEAGRLKVLQATSANQGEGKTLILANLAISLSQTGRRVLVVDADLRRPRCSTLFNVSDASGLSDVLTGRAEAMDAIQETSVPHLSILPSGPRPSNPSELLGTKLMENLLGMLREKYDYVLIDSPPLLAVSDPASLAPRVDGVLVCVRAGQTTRPEAHQAQQTLSSVGVKPAGIIVGDVQSLARYGADNQYGTGYYGDRAAKYYRQPARTDG
jgi:polysaccharide biosynthesis transport protein